MLRYGRHTFILGRVFPWKGFGGKVSEEGCLGDPYTLALGYLIKETLVTVGLPLPNGPIHYGPGFPWPQWQDRLLVDGPIVTVGPSTE